MKKIINKIKANKNLYKGLKIFKLVLDCLVYGFTIFMLIGLAISQSYKPKESEEQVELIPNVVTTPVKTAYRDDGVTYMNYSEMANPNFYYMIISTMKGSEIEPDFVALGGHITLTQPYGVYDVSYDSTNQTFTRNVAVGSIDLVYDRSLDDYWEFDIDILYYSQYATHIHFIIYYGDTNSRFIDTWIEYSSLVSSPDYNHYLSWTFDSELINYFEIPSSYENGYTGGYNQGKKEGKAEGYQEGYNVGYQGGYNVGYTDGVGSADLSSPFDVISKAFNSIASILNIQILPNLTIGVLIFTPILISLIIVVVRMIKG